MTLKSDSPKLYNFDELVEHNKIAEINSNRQNLAHAYNNVLNNIKYFTEEIKKQKDLLDKIKEEGEKENPSFENVKNLYKNSQNIVR